MTHHLTFFIQPSGTFEMERRYDNDTHFIMATRFSEEQAFSASCETLKNGGGTEIWYSKVGSSPNVLGAQILKEMTRNEKTNPVFGTLLVITSSPIYAVALFQRLSQPTLPTHSTFFDFVCQLS